MESMARQPNRILSYVSTMYDRAFRYFFGDDVFISYARADAGAYAAALAARLAAQKLAVRLDQWGTHPVHSVHPRLLAAVQRSSVLVVISSNAALQSPNVKQEIETFRKTGRWIVVVDLHGTVREAIWWPLVQGLHISREADDAIAGTPSKEVVDKIVNTATVNRKDRRQRKATIAAAAVIVIAVAVAAGSGRYAAGSLAEAEKSRQEAEKYRGESERYRGESRRYRTEAEQFSGQVTRLRGEITTLAGEAQAEREGAEKAREDASEQRRRAAAALAEQQIAEARTRRSVAQRIQSDGLLMLREQPDAAVHLAFAASRLTDDLGPVSLLRAAIASVPRWYEAVPANTKRDQLHLHAFARDGDMVGADPSMSLLVMPAAADRVAEVVLVRIPEGKQVSALRLEQGERLATPEPLASRVVLIERQVGNSKTGLVYDLTREGFAKTVSTIGPYADIELTNGDWPLYTRTEDGTVTVHNADGSNRRLGQWANITSLHAFPDSSQRAIAICEGPRITVVTYTEKESRSREVSVDGITMGLDHPPVWGPDPDKLLILTSTADGLFVHVSDGPGSVRVVHRIKQDFGLEAPTVLRARDGRRIVIAKLDDFDSVLEIVDVDWDNGGSAEGARTDWFRRGVRRANTLNMLKAVAIAQSGNVLVSAYADFGMSGTTNSVATIELWDLSTLDSRSTLNPTALELQKGDGSPVSRLAFSDDGSRLLVWDANKVSTIYRLNSARDADSLIPAEVDRRLDPDIDVFGDGGRYRRVTFAADDMRYYDIVTGKELALSKLASGKAIHDAVLDAERDSVTIATEDSLLRTTGKGVVAHDSMPRIVRASVGNDVSVSQTTNALVVHDSRTLRRLETIALEDSFKPMWIYADEYPESIVWVYAMGQDGGVRSWRSAGDGTRPRRKQSALPETGENSTIAYYASGGVMVLQSTGREDHALFGMYSDVGPTVTVIVDFAQETSPAYDPPPGRGWPDHSSSIRQLFTSDREVTVLFEYKTGDRRELVAVAWNRQSGRFLRETVIPFSGAVLMSWGSEDGYLLLMKNRSELAWIRMQDGAIVWRSKDEEHLRFPPRLTRDAAGHWTAKEDVTYLSVRRRVLMGGVDSAAAYTFVAPPEKLLAGYEIK